MKHLRAGLFLASLWYSGNLWSAELKFSGMEIGGASLVSYNSAWSQTTSTDFRLGFGFGSQVKFSLGRDSISLLFNVTKNQLLSQRIDGSTNAAICNEDFPSAFFKAPGPCSMIQVRLSPLYWIGHWGMGISFVYNYFSDFTYYGAEIYNTKRSNQALGPTAAFKQTWGKFTFVAAAHFDYAVLSQTPLSSQTVSSLQAGVTLYAMYVIF